MSVARAHARLIVFKTRAVFARKRAAMAVFGDRFEAGRLLGGRLAGAYAGRSDVVVLALPRGGVPVGYEVAARLGAPLDVLLVRKLGVPGHEELAMGAIASQGSLVINDDVVRALGIGLGAIERVAERERSELRRREAAYRAGRTGVSVTGKTVILVDDGLATGASMRVAVAALRSERPARLVVAVPVAAPDVCSALGAEVDEVVCPLTPEPFLGVGQWYRDFSPTTDEQVRVLLGSAQEEART